MLTMVTFHSCYAFTLCFFSHMNVSLYFTISVGLSIGQSAWDITLLFCFLCFWIVFFADRKQLCFLFTRTCLFHFPGVFGSSFRLIHNGAIPSLPDVSSESTSGRLQMKLRNIVRYQLVQQRSASLLAIARNCLLANSGSLMNTSIPLMVGAIAVPRCASSVLFGESFERRMDFFLRFNNSEADIETRQQAKKRLLNMFPLVSDSKGVDVSDPIYFLSYGCLQDVPTDECTLHHIGLKAPPPMHNGHQLHRGVYSGRFCRRSHNDCNRKSVCPYFDTI